MNWLVKLKSYALVISFLLLLSGCKVGEDDPFISLRSRDNRLKANWKLTEMENRYEIRTFNVGSPSTAVVINSKFDGYDMHINTNVNGVSVSDSTFGLNFVMKVKDDGKLSYETALIKYGISVKSTGDEAWYWLQTDKKKSRVYLGNALQVALSAGITQLPTGTNLNFNDFAKDFNVDGLRNKELKLSYDKTLDQTALNGNFQQVIISNKLSFKSN